MWIGIRPQRRAAVLSRDRVWADPEFGLEGDHYHAVRSTKRQVTLIQAEHVDAIARYLGLASLDPASLRRNVVISGINLLALKDKRIQVGEALLEYTGLCHPCSRMEQTLGVGGYNAVRGHGGITARVLEPGAIRCGDIVSVRSDSP